ncbi:MAG: glucokinase [Candidatus Binataceae bacterium]|nr:glucokinase [Candidatus Binataceae bacterium]
MAGMILAGDIGGTKTHLGLFRAVGRELQTIREHLYQTAAFQSLEQACAAFLLPEDRIDAACFGVPGPVIDGVSHATNVSWSMAQDSIQRALGGPPTHLMNDLEATAYGVPYLSESEVAILQRGEARAGRANIAVIAAGTGLGEAALIVTPSRYFAVASEGGHSDFAPRGDEQRRLLEFLAREFDHVSFERVLSGPGLHNIYRFVVSRSPGAEPEWLSIRMRTEDPSAVISESALEGRDPRCVHALEIFTAIYGAEAANLALKYLAIGGVYICGGIAPKILPLLQGGGLIEAFLDKGRLRTMLERISIRVSLNPSAALIGAAWAAVAMLEK